MSSVVTRHFHCCIYHLETVNGILSRFHKIGVYLTSKKFQGVLLPEGLVPSMASRFSWQLEQRKGPSQGRDFFESADPACTEMPSPGFIST